MLRAAEIEAVRRPGPSASRLRVTSWFCASAELAALPLQQRHGRASTPACAPCARSTSHRAAARYVLVNRLVRLGIFLQLAPQVAHATCSVIVRILSGVWRRPVRGATWLKRQLFRAFAGDIFVVDRVGRSGRSPPQSSMLVVACSNAVEYVGLEHRIKCDALQAACRSWSRRCARHISGDDRLWLFVRRLRAGD